VVITQFVASQDALTVSAAGVVGTIAAGNLITKLAPGAVLRDLGRTVRIPPTSSTSTYQETLREVQLVDSSAMTALVAGQPASFVNYNEGVGGTASFFVRIEPNSNAALGPVRVASLTA
jgi:hypothetical protein